MHRHFIKWPVFSLLLCCATYVSAQSTTPTQNPAQSGQSANLSKQTPTPHNNVAPSDRNQDRDINREELARFDQFLDSHREIADQLRKDPSLVNDPQCLKDRPRSADLLARPLGHRTALQNDPNAFMRAEIATSIGKSVPAISIVTGTANAANSQTSINSSILTGKLASRSAKIPL